MPRVLEVMEYSHDEYVKFETKLQVIEIIVSRAVQACGFDVLAFKGVLTMRLL